MKTAVVIPVKNEKEGLNRLIQSLVYQVSEKDEIIFVDAGSTDGSKEMIEEYRHKNQQIKVFHSQNAFPGKGRNIAIRNTDADIIAQIDGGNLPAENWLKEIVEPIKNGTADYVTGNIRIMPINRIIFGEKINLGDLYEASLYRESRGEKPVGGASVAYKRHIWEKAGGFPEWMRFGSDPVFVKKVLQQDVRMAFAEKAIVFWQIGPSFMRIMERFCRNQMAGIRTWKEIRKSAIPVCIHLIFIISVPLTFIIKPIWSLPVSIFFLLLFKRLLKTMRIYRDRVNGKSGHIIPVFLFFLAMESMGILFRITGTIRGLLALKKNRINWEIKIKKYLSS